jgi:hypothetical protein
MTKKKKTLKVINNIIGDLTELETLIARHSRNGKASEYTQLEWFTKLNDITSRLSEAYREESSS